MKINKKIIKLLVIITFIIMIANFFTLAHLTYTRILLSQDNIVDVFKFNDFSQTDLIDAYNTNSFLIFVILIFAADKLKDKKIMILSFIGAAASIVYMFAFTVVPLIRGIL